MADFSQLIADVQAVIRENGRQLITGPVLQSTLIEIINTINADKQDPLNIVDALIAGSTDPVTSGAVEAAVSGLGIDLANEVNARVAADALLIPKVNIVQTLGTATDKVPSVDLLRSQVALLQTAIGEKWTRPTVVSFDDAPDPNPIATYNGVDYYSQMDLFNAIVAQGSGGVAADTSVLAALGITPELITGANGAGSAGLIIEQKQYEIFWRSLFVKSENEWDGDDGDYYDFRDGEYWLSFHVERPEGQPETITGYFSRDEELHRSDIEQTTGISISRVMSQKAVTDALAGKQATISDLDAIRAGALLGSTAYQLPVGGIPYTDLDTGVQASLTLADHAMQPDVDAAGQLALFDGDGYVHGAGITPDDLVQKDGTYPDLTAGAVLGAPVPAEFAYRGAPYGGSAVVDTVLGNSVKWNQQVPNGNFVNLDGWTYPSGGASVADNIVTINFDTLYTALSRDINVISGHKYYVSIEAKPTQVSDLSFRYGIGGGGYFSNEGVVLELSDNSISSTTTFTKLSVAGTFTKLASDTGNSGVYLMKFGGVAQDIQVKNLMVRDLTDIFGFGNEPSTAEEFEAWMAQQGFAGLTDYNPGQVLGNAAKNLKTAGFNLWDEEWEEGSIDSSGDFVPNSSVIRGKNYIPMRPGITYKFTGGNAVIYCYDANKVLIPYTGQTGLPAWANGLDINNTTFILPEGTAYIRFTVSTAYGNVYKNDICINLSGPRNGQYEPYVGAISSIALNLSTLTGIPEGGSTSEVVFPLGLQCIGGVSDWGKGSQALRQFAVVDLGDLTGWYSEAYGAYTRYAVSFPDGKQGSPANALTTKFLADANVTDDPGSAVNNTFNIVYGRIFIVSDDYATIDDFLAAIVGVKLVCELATPVKFTLDQPLPALYETAEGGPEYIEGPAGTAPTTAPFAGEIRYSQPQADANGLAVAILDALKAASKISSYTFGIDPETSKPAITIS